MLFRPTRGGGSHVEEAVPSGRDHRQIAGSRRPAQAGEEGGGCDQGPRDHGRHILPLAAGVRRDVRTPGKAPRGPVHPTGHPGTHPVGQWSRVLRQSGPGVVIQVGRGDAVHRAGQSVDDRIPGEEAFLNPWSSLETSGGLLH
jgi:hypothetical protein